MPGAIDGLLFDLGGVVFGIDFERALQNWRELTRLSIDELRRRFAMDDAYRKHERGEIVAAEYFAHLRRVLELEASDAEIAAGWNAIYLDEVAETVDCILAVRERLPCFAFTNSNPTHQAVWEAAYPRALNAFDRIFVSSSLGLRKPERAAFAAISRATGIEASRLLFFDDTEENVVGAAAAGLPAVHVRTPADVERALQHIGTLRRADGPPGSSGD